MFGRIEGYLSHKHAMGAKLDLVEVERRLSLCRHCPLGEQFAESCPRYGISKWLMMLTDGGKDEAAAAACPGWA